MKYTNLVIKDIENEIIRQDNKWGPDRILDYHVFNTVLSEETGEYAKAVLEHNPIDMYAEIIQVAAVAAQIANRILLEKNNTK